MKWRGVGREGGGEGGGRGGDACHFNAFDCVLEGFSGAADCRIDGKMESGTLRVKIAIGHGERPRRQ
jgi:hypothetical protein